MIDLASTFPDRFLVNPFKDKDMRRWACEGLSFLTLDAEVKEKLIADTDALHSMIELAKVRDTHKHTHTHNEEREMNTRGEEEKLKHTHKYANRAVQFLT